MFSALTTRAPGAKRRNELASGQVSNIGECEFAGLTVKRIGPINQNLIFPSGKICKCLGNVVPGHCKKYHFASCRLVPGGSYCSRTKSTDNFSATVPDTVEPADPQVLGLGRAIEHLVTSLPPKERACILLKDVFDYSLEEIAELVDSTVGGVKAALNRGRAKLSAAPAPSNSRRSTDPELTRVMKLYVDRFNRRDWDGARELISADARLSVADAFAGKLADASYFSNYERFAIPWKLAMGEVDGEPVVIILQRGADTWRPHSVVRLTVVGQHIGRIVDYVHCPWVISMADSVTVVAHP